MLSQVTSFVNLLNFLTFPCYKEQMMSAFLNVFNFKFTKAKFLHNCTWYLGQILVTIEKLLILQIVAFMPLEVAKQLLSKF